MKQITLIFAFLLPFTVVGQTTTDVKALENLYSEHVAWDNPGKFVYNEQERLVVVNEFKIPVSVNTKLEVDRKNKKVKFYLQQGTAVTHTTDDSYKRAYFEIPFKTSDAAIRFKKEFELLIH